VKTEELINALVADNAVRQARFSLVFMISLIAGSALAALVFFSAIHLRPDLAAAAATPRLWLKVAVTLALVISGAKVVPRLGVPGQSIGIWGWALLAGPALLGLGVIAELSLTPMSSWWPKLIGHNARYCLVLIPLLSAGPLLCLFLALRQGAPSNTRIAGAAAGLLASSIGAALYALHCTDDSPLFGATWYSLAMVLVTAAGYALGPRLLRW
jgi:hypothetical protein